MRDMGIFRSDWIAARNFSKRSMTFRKSLVNRIDRLFSEIVGCVVLFSYPLLPAAQQLQKFMQNDEQPIAQLCIETQQNENEMITHSRRQML